MIILPPAAATKRRELVNILIKIVFINLLINKKETGGDEGGRSPHLC